MSVVSWKGAKVSLNPQHDKVYRKKKRAEHTAAFNKKKRKTY